LKFNLIKKILLSSLSLFIIKHSLTVKSKESKFKFNVGLRQLHDYVGYDGKQMINKIRVRPLSKSHKYKTLTKFNFDMNGHPLFVNSKT